MKAIPLEGVMSDPDKARPAGRQDPADRRRFEQGLPDYHNPLGGIGGAPPARSALTLRLVLAGCGLLLSIGGAVLLAALSAPVGFVILLAAIALTAVIDIVVILRRKRRGEPG
jgi:hypothetical protein